MKKNVEMKKCTEFGCPGQSCCRNFQENFKLGYTTMKKLDNEPLPSDEWLDGMFKRIRGESQCWVDIDIN